MITSPDNQQLKTIRKLADKRHRNRSGLFVAEGEDLIAAAEAAGLEPEALLVSVVAVALKNRPALPSRQPSVACRAARRAGSLVPVRRRSVSR